MKPRRFLPTSSLVTVAVIVSALLSTASPAQQDTVAAKAPKTFRPPISVQFEIEGNPITLHIDSNGAVVEATGGVEAKRDKIDAVHDVTGTHVTTRILDNDASPIAVVSTDPFGLNIRFALRSDRPWLGVDLEPAPAALAEHLDLDPEKVSVVAGVRNDSPAAKSDLRVNDIVIAVDGTPVANADEVRRAITDHKPGDTLDLTVLRKGKQREITITVGRAPLAGAAGTTAGRYQPLDPHSFARLADPLTTHWYLGHQADARTAVIGSLAEYYTRSLRSEAEPTLDSPATPSAPSDPRLAALEQRLANIEAMLEKLTSARKDH